MPDAIRTAVIGAGMYGNVHLKKYQADERTEPKWVWSRSEERARRVGEEFGVQYTTELQPIVDDPEVEIVSVATPDFAHCEPSVMMLEAGKHVLLEKPMATTVADCEAILKARDQSGKKLMIDFENRWSVAYNYFREVIRRGEVGQPAMAYARLSDRLEVATEWLPWAGESGPEWFLMPHIIDLVSWVTGQKVTEVVATARKDVLRAHGVDAYDSVQAQLRFETFFGTFESSWILPPSWPALVDMRIDLLCTKGRIRTGEKPGIEVAADEYKHVSSFEGMQLPNPISHFVNCVVDDIAPESDGENGLYVTRVIEAICQSAEEGRTVEV